MLYLWLTWIISPVLTSRIVRQETISPQKILVIQMAKIGDMICSTPVFREIKKYYPQSHLTVMAAAHNASLLKINPWVDDAIIVDAKSLHGFRGKFNLVRNWRKQKYDTLVCLNTGTVYAIAALWSGIPRRLSVQSNFMGLSNWFSARLWSAVERHQGDRLIQKTYLALLEKLGISSTQKIHNDIFIREGADKKVSTLLGKKDKILVGIGISSANRLKALGSRKICEIAYQIYETYPRVSLVLIGDISDQSQAQEIIDFLPSGIATNACGMLDIADLPALLQRLVVFIGVDSGVTYMADALGVPLVSVAGPCNIKETHPLGGKVVLLQKSDIPCVPCAHIFRAPYSCYVKSRACIEEISATEIVRAVMPVLEESLDKFQHQS